MNKKIFNILVIFMLLFVGFFININRVKADISGHLSSWSAPIPLISSDERFVNVDFSFGPKAVSVLKLRAVDDGEYIKLAIVTQESPVQNVRSNVGNVTLEKDYNTNQTTFYLKDKIKSKDFYDAEYIKVYIDDGELAYSKATQNDYENQYNNFNVKSWTEMEILGNTKWEYYVHWLVDSTACNGFGVFCTLPFSVDSNNNFYDIKTDGIVYSTTDSTPTFIKFLNKIGGFVLKFEHNNVYYDKEKTGMLNKYHDLLVKYVDKINSGDSNYSINDLYNSWTTLSNIIEIPSIDKNTIEYSTNIDVDTRAQGNEFYKKSINLLNSLLGDDVRIVNENIKNIKNNSSSNSDPYSGTSKGTKPRTAGYFERWFYYAGRYLFDNDIKSFIKYYKYNYAKELINNSTQHVLTLEVLENINDISKTFDTKDKIVNDKCIIYCSSCISTDYVKQTDSSSANDEAIGEINSQACTQCVNTNQRYKECSSARNTCNNLCSTEDCFNTCMDSRLTDYTKTLNDMFNKIDSLQTDVVEKNIKNLTTLLEFYSAPTLDIKFNPSGYIIDCDDVSFLHTIYMIIIILAPILVIILGSLDFFKAMLQSDEQKMNKFKKAFPKRLIMLILLIVIPIVISFLTSTTGLSDTLMKCVVNG